MYKRSVRRAYFGMSPHMWPFHAWWSVVVWSGLAGAAAIAISYIVRPDVEVVGWLIFGGVFWAGYGFFLLAPAAVLAVLDLILVRRPRHRPAKFNARSRRVDRQSLANWAGFAAAVAGAFGLAYLFVYLNAFAPTRSYQRLVAENLMRFVVGGAGAGAVVAWMLNKAHDEAPARSPDEQLRRGAILWASLVVGFAGLVFYFFDPTLERTLLPGGLLAVIGAAVIPQLAVTPPMDLSQIPPPPLPSAPSPGPTQDPEGGKGEGARGDWRSAPPPKFPSSQSARSNPGSITTTREVVNG